MKKLIATTMAAMMALTIVGCGGNNTVALQSDKAEETTKADSDATHLVCPFLELFSFYCSL